MRRGLLLEFTHAGAQTIPLARDLVAIGSQLLHFFLPLVEPGLLPRLLLGQIHNRLAEPGNQRDALGFGEVQFALRLFERVA